MSRMAGQALSRSERNRQTRERIGNDPERLEERLSAVDRDQFDFKGYDDKAINMAFQGGEFGADDYARLTGNTGTPDSDPVNTTPVDTEPVDNTPVDTTPVDNTPVTAEPVDTDPVETPTPITQESQQEADSLLNGYVQQVQQEQSFDRDFGDNQNTIGNENQIYGNVNQGNQDFSVNIGSQSVSQGGGSGSGSGETNLNNMQTAAAYGGLNENQYQKSQALLNPYAKAQGNIDATKESTGVGESNRAANELYGSLRDLYRSQAVNYHTNLFGDYFNQSDYKPPKWNPPAAPSVINPDYD